jgi:hypothetical protein
MTGEPGRVGQQRGESLYPAKDRDVVDLNPAFGQQFLHVSIGKVEAQVPAHRDTIISGGNRNPVNADFGGDQERGRIDSLTGQACPDLANAQRNGTTASQTEVVACLRCLRARAPIQPRASRHLLDRRRWVSAWE